MDMPHETTERGRPCTSSWSRDTPHASEKGKIDELLTEKSNFEGNSVKIMEIYLLF